MHLHWGGGGGGGGERHVVSNEACGEQRKLGIYAHIMHKSSSLHSTTEAKALIFSLGLGKEYLARLCTV